MCYDVVGRGRKRPRWRVRRCVTCVRRRTRKSGSVHASVKRPSAHATLPGGWTRVCSRPMDPCLLQADSCSYYGDRFFQAGGLAKDKPRSAELMPERSSVASASRGGHAQHHARTEVFSRSGICWTCLES